MGEDEIDTLATAVGDSTSRAQIEGRWREQALGYREILVAIVEGRIVGTVSIHETADPPASLHLFALDVAEGWRDRGIGTAIIRHVITEARRRGRRRVYLEVRTDNRSRRLYHRLGFRRVGRPFINAWWRSFDDGRRERVEEPSYRMVRRVF
jgi:ribosomal protein S18 acetylase RimI-like enzyme